MDRHAPKVLRKIRKWLNLSPKPHQINAFLQSRQAIANSGGVLLALEMGLGKTLVAILHILRDIRRQRRATQTRHYLVLAPTSAILEWQVQLKTHINYEALRHNDHAGIRICTYAYFALGTRGNLAKEMCTNTDASTPSTIFLCSYDMARNDGPALLSLPWRCLVMDECHKLKNRDAQLHGLLRRYLPADTLRIGMSGTPNANNPVRDMCSLAEILFPQQPKLHAPETYRDGPPSDLGPLVVCQTADGVGLKLPPLREETVWLTMEQGSPEWQAYQEQHDLTIDRRLKYLRARPDYKAIALKAYQCALSQLAYVNTHYQVSDLCNDSLAAVDAATSSKEKAVYRLTRCHEPIGSRKIVVTSISAAFLKMIHAKREQVCPGAYVLYTGGMSLKAKAAALASWRRPEGPSVLLLSTRAGGTGLTLVDAARMIIVDGMSVPNPADNAQVQKRVHRMGQTHDSVHIILLCNRGSIDEVMCDLVHPAKRRAACRLLGVSSTVRAAYASRCGANAPSSSTKRKRSATGVEIASIGGALVPYWERQYPSAPQAGRRTGDPTTLNTRTAAKCIGTGGARVARQVRTIARGEERPRKRARKSAQPRASDHSAHGVTHATSTASTPVQNEFAEYLKSLYL